MITLFSTIFGIIGSVIPNLVKILERRQDFKHEREILQIRLDAAAKGVELQYDAEIAKASVEEGKSLRDHDIMFAGNEFLDTLRSSIRPVLTYFFFFMFCGIKITAATFMFENGYNPIEILNAVWDVYTAAIFGTVIGFWFGNRSMNYVLKAYVDKPNSYKIGRN